MNSSGICSFWTCFVTYWKRQPHLCRGERPAIVYPLQCECQRFPVTNEATKSFVVFHNRVRSQEGSVEGRGGAGSRRPRGELHYGAASDDQAVDEQQDHGADDRADPAGSLFAT